MRSELGGDYGATASALRSLAAGWKRCGLDWLQNGDFLTNDEYALLRNLVSKPSRGDFGDWCKAAVDWHSEAFPKDTFEQIGLCLGEEATELVETYDLLRDFIVHIGKVERSILKEGHGANDRRADTDWRAERYKEFGDVMVALSKLARHDDVDLLEACWDRLDQLRERFPRAIA